MSATLTLRTPHGWQRVGMPDGYDEMWERHNGSEVPPPIAFQRGPIRVLVGHEPYRDETWRWHLSVSAPGRLPTWDEMVEAAHGLRPGVPFVMGVPPRSWWMNVHPHVLHMWETVDAALIAVWRDNAQGHTPS